MKFIYARCSTEKQDFEQQKEFIIFFNKTVFEKNRRQFRY